MKKMFYEFLHDPKWEKIRAVLWFCLITVIIHFAWRFWVNSLNYFPVKNFMSQLSGFFTVLVFDQSTWFITHIFNMKISISENVFSCPSNYSIAINESCSGIKQILQFALLLMIIPGPWKKKLWYIPLGMVIVHFTNILRISLLSVVANNWPAKMQYYHDNWLRILFYVVIFLLWLIWVEWIGSKNKKMENGK
jgi:exosortase/archaeosortase family protein